MGARRRGKRRRRRGLHVGTAERVISRRDPWVNMLRATIAGFAAGIAGADGVAVAPYDQGWGLSTDFGRRIARNAQVILQESALGQVIDPSGGSWFIELTERLAQAAQRRFQEIEAAGRVAAMLADGRLQAAVAGYGRRAAQLAIDAPKSLRSICLIWMRKHRPAQWHGRKSSRLARAAARAGGGRRRFGDARGGRSPWCRHRRSQRWEAADGEILSITIIAWVRVRTLRDASDAWAKPTASDRGFHRRFGDTGGPWPRVDFTRNIAAGGIEALDGRGAPDEIAAAFTASGRGWR